MLDFGRVRARIGASEARALQALAGYEQTVATALEETDGALTQFTSSAQQADKLASAARKRRGRDPTVAPCASMPARSTS